MRKLNFIIAIYLVLLSWSCTDDEPEIKSNISGNRISSIYIDDEGVCWFGTENGLSAYDGSIWKNYSAKDGLPEGTINDIDGRSANTGKQILTATINGAGILDKVLNLINSVSIILPNNSGLAADKVLALAHDFADVTWYGTERGISIESDGEWMDSEDNDVIEEYTVTDIAAGPDSIAFVCLAGRGVALMNPGVDAVTTVTYYEWPFSPLPSDIIQAIYIKDYHHQWIGTDNGLAFHGNFDPKKEWELFYEEDGLIDNNVLSVMGDGNGITWIGTVAGVSSYNGEEWNNYTVEDGLAGDSVFCIAIDPDGSVWFGTNSGASEFNNGNWTTFRME